MVCECGCRFESGEDLRLLPVARRAGKFGGLFLGNCHGIDQQSMLSNKLRTSCGEADSVGTTRRSWHASLEAIENETIDRIDAITREVISKLLGKQADHRAAQTMPQMWRRTLRKALPRPLDAEQTRQWSISNVMSFVARLAASIFFPQFKILGCDVDQAQTPAVLKKVSIAASRDRSYDTASRNLSRPRRVIGASQAMPASGHPHWDRTDGRTSRANRGVPESLAS